MSGEYTRGGYPSTEVHEDERDEQGAWNKDALAEPVPESESDPESEAAVDASSAQTGLIHTPVRQDEDESEPAVESAYPADTEAAQARSEEAEELDSGTWGETDEADETDETLEGGEFGEAPVQEAEPAVVESPVEVPEQQADPGYLPGSAAVPDSALPEETSTYASAGTVPGAVPGTDFVERMQEIQLAFIDDPRRAALDADDLLAEALQAFADDMARRRSELEDGTTDGAAPDTERLRQAVRRSRELVDALGHTE